MYSIDNFEYYIIFLQFYTVNQTLSLKCKWSMHLLCSMDLVEKFFSSLTFLHNFCCQAQRQKEGHGR